MLLEFKFIYSYKVEENGKTEYFTSEFPIWAEGYNSAKRTARQFALDLFGGLYNPFTVYGGATITLMYYFVKWKI